MQASNAQPQPGDEAPRPLPAAAPATGIRRVRALLLRECTVAESSVIYAGAFLLSAVLGVVRQMLLNRQFGTGTAIEAYYAAFRLPETLHTLLAGGTLANALIPVLLMVRVHAGELAARRFINIVATTLLAVIVPLVVLCMLVAPWFVAHILAPGFDPATSALTVTLTRLLLLELVLAVLVGVATGVLISRNQVILPALAIASQNITLMIGIGVAMQVPTVGIFGPAFGAIGDLLLQLAILLPGLWWQGIRLRPLWAPRDPHLRQVIRLLIPNGLSGAVNYAGTIIDTSVGSLARTAGSVAAQYNAALLFGLPVRLFGVAIGQAALPRLSEHVAQGDWRHLRQGMLRAIGAALGLSLLTIAGILVLGRISIRILFEGGEFSAAAGDLTYTLLLIYALALPAATATEVLTRCLIALHDTLTPLLVNLAQLVLRGLLAFGLLPYFDILAVVIAFAVTAALETLLMGGALLRKLRRQRDPRPPEDRGNPDPGVASEGEV